MHSVLGWTSWTTQLLQRGVWNLCKLFYCLVAKPCPTVCVPRGLQHSQASLSTISPSLLRLVYIESVGPPNHLILCCPLLLLPSIFPSIKVFSKESVLPIRWPKYWSFSFRTDWFDLLAIWGTLKSLLQHHSSNILIFQHSAFFMVQLSHPYMTTGKSIALTRWISKMSSEGNYDVLLGWSNLILWLGPKVRCGFIIMNGISHIFHNCLWR